MSSTLNVSSAQIQGEVNKGQKEIFILTLLASVQFIFLMDYVLIMPLGATLVHEFHLNPTKFGFLMSVYTLSASIAGFTSSFFIDKFDRKKALLFLLTGFAMGPLFSSWATGFTTLLIARIISGAFGGILSSTIMAIIGDLIPAARLGRATSFVVSANAIASILGVPAGVYLAHHFGWQMPFKIMIGIVAALVGLIYYTLPSINKHLTNRPQSNVKILALIKNPDIKFPILFMSLLTLAGGYTILPFLSTYLSHNVSFTNEDIVLVFFFGGIASFVAGPFVGFLTDRFGKQNVFLLINFLSILAIILVTIYPLESKFLTLVATTLFFMVGTGRMVSGMSLVNSRFHKEHRGRLLSITSAIQMFVGTIGTYISGTILYTEDAQIINYDLIGTIALSATIICIFTAFIIDE